MQNNILPRSTTALGHFSSGPRSPRLLVQSYDGIGALRASEAGAPCLCLWTIRGVEEVAQHGYKWPTRTQ